jgi:Ni,Fe-hydrogenase III small subunit/formate hydrogenlyase subunit 6/NADH:ubiquinone oxidoreductase subunit I
MLRILINALRTGVVTTGYPEQPSPPPDRFRGQPELRPGTDLPPSAACPVGAIVEQHDAEGQHRSLDLAKCIFCGRCTEDPWAGAVAMGREFELASRSRDDLRIEVKAGAAGLPIARPAADREAESARASAEIQRVLGRSLHLRHLDAGSCNACDFELTALLNPVYDIRRLGIDFVASPRHADGVVITGPITRNLETAVRRTIEAVPAPRIVIAVGACATGGIFGEGYASLGGVDKLLPVDVYIPGCPPRPQSIIFGILVALGRLNARRLA